MRTMNEITNEKELIEGRRYRVKFESCDGCVMGEFEAVLLEVTRPPYMMGTMTFDNGLSFWAINISAEEVI